MPGVYTRHSPASGVLRCTYRHVVRLTAVGRRSAVSNDTKWIIGTIVPAILVVAGLLSVQISGVNTRIDDMNSRLERLETDVRSLDSRLRAVEIAFAKIDQRLETLERAILPAAEPAD